MRFLLFLSLSVTTFAGQFFVAPTGRDVNPGTKTAPWRTISHAIDKMQPGDTCLLRAGRYDKTVDLQGKQKLTFRAYPGEDVFFDGSEAVEGEWKPAGNNIWTLQTPLRFNQLFANGVMLPEARWPNCPPGEHFNRDTWAQSDEKSEYQKLHDEKLAATGIDWNGGTAVLNVAHQFFSWSRTVEGYEPGSATLPYTIKMNPFHTEGRNWWHDDFYYLSGKKEALDAPGEWFLDSAGNLFIVSKKMPRNIRVKQRDYFFKVSGSTNITLSGFRSFACTFRLDNCNGCLVEYCNLSYPSYDPAIPEGEEKGKRRQSAGTIVSGKKNRVDSCSLAHCPNYGIKLAGEQNEIENCLIYDVNWSGTLMYTGIRLGGGKDIAEPRNVARHNTLFNIGNTALSCSGPFSVVEYNHVHHGGLVSSDVSLIYTCMPKANGVEFRYNWVHDSLSPNHSLGIRGDDKTRGLRVHHNVIWNIGSWGIVTKGGRNRVYNNTCFANGAADFMFNSGPEPDKWWQKHVKAYQHQNEDSLLVNNCAQVILSRARGQRQELPGDHSHNYSKKDIGLVDPDNFDFRPRPDSPLTDAGRKIDGVDLPFAGAAPDIGAYEANQEPWLPGHRNGLWLSREASSLQVRLNLPPLKPVQIQVEERGKTFAQLTFTPENWFRKQSLPNAPTPLTFRQREWGTATLPSTAKITPLQGARLQFSKPDLTSLRICDSSPKFDYEDAPTKAKEVVSVYRAYYQENLPGESIAETPERSIKLFSLSQREPTTVPAAKAYAFFNETFLTFFVRVDVKGNPLLQQGGTWGPQGSGGLEFDLGMEKRKRVNPAFILHCYPSGKLESCTDDGLEEEQAQAFAQKVEYKILSNNGHQWSCSLKVPLEVFGEIDNKHSKLRFNIGLRCNGAPNGPWFAAAKTGGANYNLSGAAILQLERGLRADAKNLLQNGTFEAADSAPWRITTNRRLEIPEGTATRVPSASSGGYCMQLQANDPEVMKERVYKWVHPLDGLEAGRSYCLSYDVCIPDKKLSLCGSLASFNSYLHVRRNKKSGGNLGQPQSVLQTTKQRWIHRDFRIDVPANCEPSMISLQLHHATGTVLFDNVSLLLYEKQ